LKDTYYPKGKFPTVKKEVEVLFDTILNSIPDDTSSSTRNQKKYQSK
jgi:hypothetical protein